MWPVSESQSVSWFKLFFPALVVIQEPGPAKVAVTGSGIPEADKSPDSSSIIWQEELNQREAESAAAWAGADQPLGSPLPSAGDLGFSVIRILCQQSFFF